MRISDWSSDVCSSDLDPGDGYLYACSIGFNVSQGGTPGYVTAGHCGDTGEPVYLEGPDGTGPQWTVGPKIGRFAGSSSPKPGGRQKSDVKGQRVSEWGELGGRRYTQKNNKKKQRK